MGFWVFCGCVATIFLLVIFLFLFVLIFTSKATLDKNRQDSDAVIVNHNSRPKRERCEDCGKYVDGTYGGWRTHEQSCHWKNLSGL